MKDKFNKEKFDKFIDVFNKEYAPYLFVLLLIILFKSFVYTPVRVNGASMNNTLKDKEILLLNIIDYKFHDIKRYDIVVIDIKKERLIKRVIGMPGDTIEFKDKQLFINGKLIKNKFAYGFGDTDDFKVKVPKGHYYCLGDNRGNSLDSRHFGAFPRKEIIGKTDIRLMPFKKFGEIDK